MFRPFRAARDRVAPAVFVGAVVAFGLALGGVGTSTAVAVAPTAHTGAAAMDDSDGDGISEVTDAVAADTESEAATIANQYGHAVLINTDSSETIRTTAQPDGETQVDASSSPQLVPDGNGWQPVNTALAQVSGGTIAPQATDVPVEFGDDGSSLLAKVEDPDGNWVTENWDAGNLPIPTVSGDTAIYSDVMPGVDLDLTATSTGMSEILVVNTPAAADNTALDHVKVDISGATVSTASSGTTTASADGAKQLISAVPTWWDSSTPGSGADGPSGGQIAQAVPTSSTPSQVSIDAAAPTATDPTYPLFVDPDWQWTGNTYHYWFTDKAYPDTSYLDGAQNTTSENMGYLDAGDASDGRTHLARTYYEIQMRVNGTNVLGGGKVISSATFNAEDVWAYNCTPSSVRLYRVNDDTDAGDTYNNTPSDAFSGGERLTTLSAAHGRTGCGAATVAFPATDAATWAQTHNPAELRFGLMADDETSPTGWKRWGPTVHFIVNYDTPPGVPTNPIISSPQRACSTDWTAPVKVNNHAQAVNLQTDMSDADASTKGDTDKDIFSVFSIDQTTGSATTLSPQPETEPGYVSPDSGSGKSSIPIDALTPGQEYAWQVKTEDKPGQFSSGSSTLCYFEDKTTSPGLPTINAVSLPSTWTIGSPAAFTFTDNTLKADGPDAMFVYWVTGGTETQPATSVPVSAATVAAIPPCGSGIGSARYACVASTSGSGAAETGTSDQVTVAPIDRDSTLYVAIMDAAGNIGSGTPVHYPNTTSPAESYPLQPANGHAQTDTAEVNYTSGHDWSAHSSNGTSIPDAHNSSGVALPVSAPWVLSTTDGSTIGDIVQSPRVYSELNVFKDAAASRHMAIIDDATVPQFTYADTIGDFLPYIPGQPDPSGMRVLYDCPELTGNEISELTTCSRMSGTPPKFGYTWGAATDVPAGTTAVHAISCEGIANDFYLTVSTCGSDTEIGGAGYVALASPLATSAAVTNLGGAFTVSARLSTTGNSGDQADDSVESGTPKAYAISNVALMGSDPTTQASYTIGSIQPANDPNQYWQFCVTLPDRTSALSTSCVHTTTALTTDSAWYFITGEWDPRNQQLRIYINGSSPVAQWHDAMPSSFTSAANLQIGSGINTTAPSGWPGEVADVSTFDGVASGAELNSIASDGPIS